ncbi:MAG: GNAT family N-acetyltransferase [Dehalococcoidia bacterium]
MPSYRVRQLTPDDASAADDLVREAFEGLEADFPGCEEALARGLLVLTQTGSRVLVAEDAAGIAGVVRWWDDDGIAWFDLLTAAAVWAGLALLREVERSAQEHGLRLVRARIPEDAAMEGYFWRARYREVGREGRQLLLERRLPLLTVRAQRRADAAGIAALTGADPWPFEQGARPGWFVLADGERVCGTAAVREVSPGMALVHSIELDATHRGRGIEVWLLERAAEWAETHGAFAVETEAAFIPAALERDLEDRGWFREGQRYVRRSRGEADEDGRRD